MSNSEGPISFCPTCGSQQLNPQSFCPKCGNSLRLETLGAQPLPAAVAPVTPVPGSRRYRKILVGGVFGFVALLLVGGMLTFFSGENESAPRTEAQQQSDESRSKANDDDAEPNVSLAGCLLTEGYSVLPEETNLLITEMGLDIDIAVATGTEAALRGVSQRFSSKYGPAFINLGRKWRELDDCGDATLASYRDRLGDDLEAVGDVLSGYEYGDNSALELASEYLDNVGTAATDFADYIDTLG